MGPWISMAPAGWEDSTTNRKAALSLEYTWTARRAMAIGEDTMKSFWPSDLGQKNYPRAVRLGDKRE